MVPSPIIYKAEDHSCEYSRHNWERRRQAVELTSGIMRNAELGGMSMSETSQLIHGSIPIPSVPSTIAMSLDSNINFSPNFIMRRHSVRMWNPS